MATIKKIILPVVVLLMAASQPSFAQYIQKLYDIDTTVDWGWACFVKPDSTYMIFGWSYDTIGYTAKLTSLHVSNDGNTIILKRNFSTNSTAIFPGDPGEVKQLADGNYIVPLNLQTPNLSYTNSAAGLAKLTTSGDTIFLKAYTDTSKHFDNLWTCAEYRDGGYILGGGRSRNTPMIASGLILRTNSNGDTVWVRTYQKDTMQSVAINRVIPLPDGRIIVGARSTYIADAGGIHHIPYYHHTPWFFIIDSFGNIIKDTLYGNRYMGSGRSIKTITEAIFTSEDLIRFIRHFQMTLRIFRPI